MRLKEYRLEISVIAVVAVFTIIQAMSEDTSLTKTMNGIGVILLAIGMIGVNSRRNRK